MKCVLNAGTSLLALYGLQLASFARSLNPLEKTVELLTSLQGQVVADGERQQDAYEIYAHWCEETCAEKAEEVKGFSKQKAKLEAAIQSASSDIEASTTKIEELGNEVSSDEQKKTDFTEARDAERETFEDAEKELAQTMDMMGRAIEVLEKEMEGSKASLVQTAVDTDSMENVLFGLGAIIDAAGIPSQDMQKLAALLQARQDSKDGDGLSAPSAASYETHSDGIVEVLEDMRDKAEQQLRLLREGEVKSQANYALMLQSVKKQIKNLEKDMKDEKADKAASEEAKATAEGDLSVALSELGATRGALKSTRDSCLRTAADHETSTQGRNGELAALAKAKKVIQASMLQESISFVQLSSKSTAKVRMHSHLTPIGRQVVMKVKQLAAQQKSMALGQLASRLNTVFRLGTSSSEDPFAKVKKLLVGMINQLQDEMSADAKEKAYCDDELRKTEDSIQDLTDKIDGLGGRKDQREAKTATLQSMVRELQQELAALAKEQAELDRARTVSRDAFLMTKADLQKSLDGTRSAIQVLRDYYANDDEDASSAALLQNDDSFRAELKQPKPPKMFSKSSGAGSSIIGILEVSESDIAKNLAEEATEESGKQAEYEKLTKQSKILRVQKDKDVAYHTAEYKAVDKALTDVRSDFSTESEELEALQEYFAKVKERCIAKPEPYKAQKERRDAEIKGLREALTILQSNGQTTLLQRGRQGEPTAIDF